MKRTEYRVPPTQIELEPKLVVETTFVNGRVYANAELERYMETLPVEEVPLVELADQVGPEHTYWIDEVGAPLRPYDLLKDWNAALENPLWKSHVASIQRANLDTPIWKVRDGHVIDGMHRLTRAVLDGVETVKVRFVDEIPDSIPFIQ